MSIGPVEYIVVGFPGNEFKGEIAPALADLVDNGTIKIHDIVFITKDTDGDFGAVRVRRARRLAGVRVDRR